jgi:hypothetical protein
MAKHKQRRSPAGRGSATSAPVTDFDSPWKEGLEKGLLEGIEAILERLQGYPDL